MTEAELAEIAMGYASNAAGYFTLWLTILSAYAVTTHLAGNRLTTLQVVWLNTLYLVGALLAIVGFYGALHSQLYYIGQLKNLNPNSPQILRSEITFSLTAFAIAATIATLAFMWQVRHPKTE